VTYTVIPFLADTHRGVAFGIFVVVRLFVQIMFFLTGNYGLLRGSSIILEFTAFYSDLLNSAGQDRVKD